MTSLWSSFTLRFHIVPLESRHSQDSHSWVSNMFDIKQLSPDNFASEQIGECWDWISQLPANLGRKSGLCCSSLEAEHLYKSLVGTGWRGLGVRQRHTTIKVWQSDILLETCCALIAVEFKRNTGGWHILGGVNGSSQASSTGEQWNEDRGCDAADSEDKAEKWASVASIHQTSSCFAFYLRLSIFMMNLRRRACGKASTRDRKVFSQWRYPQIHHFNEETKRHESLQCWPRLSHSDRKVIINWWKAGSRWDWVPRLESWRSTCCPWLQVAN